MLKSYYALVLCDSPCDAQDTVERMQAQGLDATAVGQGVQVSRQFTLREEGPKYSPQWEVSLMNAITDEIGAEEMIRDAVKATGKPYVLLDEADADSSIRSMSGWRVWETVRHLPTLPLWSVCRPS